MMENWCSDTQKRCKDFDENFRVIREKMAESALKSGREVSSVRLLAATKTVPVEIINYAISSGLSCLGENRVQEFLSKYDELDKEHCDCQFIGSLQSNKVKDIIGKVSCIQSVDSVKLAREISARSEKAEQVTRILLEVNIGRELQKGGVMPEKLLEVLDEIRELPYIRVNGLMTVPPVCETKKEIMEYFSAMYQYYVDIKEKKLDNVSMNCLSMGMSSDYEEAIACGSTMIRVGSSLFGARDTLK